MSLRSRLTKIGAELKSAGEAAGRLSLRRGATDIAEPGPEPPVIARLVVEVRSDGSRTIARGAIEAGGEAAALEARGTTPAQLAASLARSLFTAPVLLRQMARSGGRDQDGPEPSGQIEGDPAERR